ncbi:excinuclease ABC subunit UvrC [Soehngenia longivitae]|uniref:UvrABC system protein C n=1 Tax=Soehngenia longivitae TaxID=2562294 RepID=A0A4Z0D6A3_9FIRM|nr:excinuclease ABC subunit UvrC [Soehngenia longivitae]TFZ40394.1 excinuclease ABC subunit UvrC [Soehngenia longivitae]
MYDLEERLKSLPEMPGVYIMKDKSDEIIYVGKAINLKKRVSQYFNNSKNHSLKVMNMVKNISDFEYIIVNNEVEALILESNLIKKNRPKYNIILRDDKQYPYIKVTVNEKYPRILKTRKLERDGAKYFGPYPSAYSVNEAIKVFHDIFPIRDCKLNLNKLPDNFRPCLNYHIGRCKGPCIGMADEDEYNQMIDQIVRFLSRKDNAILEKLEYDMKNASDTLNFELASIYRDRIQALLVLVEKQNMSNPDLTEEDIIAIARGIEEVLVQVFFVREGKIIGREHYILEDNLSTDRPEIIASFIKQFYSGANFIPKEIIVEEEISDQSLIEEYLSDLKGNRVKITVPKRGDKLELVDMAKKNAIDMLDKYGDKFLRKHRENMKALEELQYVLDLDEVPSRIEAYDISNINGVGNVGSMVVFEKGEAKKTDYRRFKIKTLDYQDDYKSMEEVLRRRFLRGIESNNDENKSNSFSIFPDLIMVDGGKGHVNMARSLLRELGINIEVCGLVKDDFHKTRGIIYKNREINLDKDSLAFKLIYRIQEEAHRFAISYHRSLRSKDMFRSELDGINLIGEKRKINLLKYFGSISKIKAASIEELNKVPGMTQKASESLYNHFNKGEK